MGLIEDVPARANTPEFSVSEIAGAVKRMIEGEFAFVRVRGEIGRVSRPASGHLYFDLKDTNATLSAVAWKGTVARLSHRPEEGMEMVAVGRLTTFSGQSKYQMLVEDLVPAGAGALMAQLEARKRKLAAEGLFDANRKRPIPYLPGVIGVVTSPSGAVIRDILHRLRDRFPRTVLVWPVAVQGANCPPEVVRAVQGFNALPPDGPIPRPDVLIVARGGGSVEDLWGFNDESVVRAVAASQIPVISAVGHETDTTLIDFAADLRAPTPTAAAEMAVPVRAELLDRTADLGLRAARALRGGVALRRQRLGDLARGLPRAEAILAGPAQRLDFAAQRLPLALRGATQKKRLRLADLRVTPAILTRAIRDGRRRLGEAERSLAPALARNEREGVRRLGTVALRLDLAQRRVLDSAREALLCHTPRLEPLATRRAGDAASDLARVARRLTPDLARARIARAGERLDALARLGESLGFRATLARGFAVVRADGHAVATAAEAARHAALELEFADGRLALGARPAAPKRKPAEAPEAQGTLL